MGFSLPEIIVSFLFSAVGFIYFRIGKNRVQYNLLFCGMALMGYSYFVPNVTVSIGLGVGLTVLPFLLKWW